MSGHCTKSRPIELTYQRGAAEPRRDAGCRQACPTPLTDTGDLQRFAGPHSVCSSVAEKSALLVAKPSATIAVIAVPGSSIKDCAVRASDSLAVVARFSVIRQITDRTTAAA